MASIELTGITKAFVSGKDKHLAVDNLNLTIGDGEFVSLVGPSGCGKSTTLRMIAGLEMPDQGRIDINGKNVTFLPPQQRDLSMVFQNYAIFPHMTVRQNIGYGLRIAGMPTKEREVRVREVARLVDIEPLLDRYPRQLSGGQRQRVAVARAFARDPEIVLLDEPLSNLDAKLRDQTRAELKQLHQRVQHTMVYVTHDQLEALTLSDRIAVMNGGVIQQFASPSTIFHRPANLFVATFIGSPTMNTMPAKLTRGAAQAQIRVEGGWRVEISHDGAGWGSGTGEADVVLGIRPKDILVERSERQGTIPATVMIVEPIGSEVIVHMEAAGRKLVAEVHESVGLRPGDRVSLDFPKDRLHVFDLASGDALFHGSLG